MNPKHRNDRAPTFTARNLRVLYRIGLTVVAFLTLASQFYVQVVIDSQQDDASVINVAGRQRMLSQRLAKLALMLQADPNQTPAIQLELSDLVETFTAAHNRLRHGNESHPPASHSEAVKERFEELQVHLDAIVAPIQTLLDEPSPTEQAAAVAGIIVHEQQFLPRMNTIVGLLSHEAKQRVERLRYIELLLYAFVIIALTLEAIFIFEPAAREISSQFDKLQMATHRIKSEFAALNRSSARLELDPDGRITDVNDMLLTFLSGTREHLIGQSYLQLHAQTGNELPDNFWSDLRSGESIRGEYVWRTMDGSHRNVEVSFSPVLDALRRVERIVVYCIDVTKKHVAEKEKEALNLRMREIARHAGKAEVASGILHNLGNAVNGISVSAQILKKRIAALPTKRIARFSELFKNDQQLEESLSNGDRRALLRDYLKALSENLETSQEGLLSEVESLSGTAADVDNICAMQKTLAGQKERCEEVQVGKLIEEAVQLSRNLIARNQTELTWSACESVIFTRRFEVLEILLNLVRNAIEATRECGRDSVVRMIAHAEQDEVVISVSDNGIGMKPTELKDVFRMGFTTKKNGSGYGLHNCANLVNAMGGSITAHSEGVDEGATFVLRLPFSCVDIGAEQPQDPKATS